MATRPRPCHDDSTVGVAALTTGCLTVTRETVEGLALRFAVEPSEHCGTAAHRGTTYAASRLRIESP